MIHNAYLDLVIFYIGLLRKEICAQSIPREPTSGYTGARGICVYTCICISVPQWLYLS